MILLLFVVISRIGLSLSRFEGASEVYSQWKSNYSKGYSCEYEENRSFCNFKRNVERINDHNSLRGFAYRLGLWARSDLSEFEINKMYNGLESSPVEPEVEDRAFFLGGVEIITPTVKDFDWRTAGVITGIRDQMDCSCCYALAATGALEAQISLKTGHLRKLSDQQIIDCSFTNGNGGCGGGNTWNAYNYIRQNGLTGACEYPFEARDTGACNFNNESMKVTPMVRARYVRITSADFLKDLLYSIGPLTVGMDASLFTFLNYKSGVYNDPECSTNLNHAMLLVGFGSDNVTGLDYWLLKNSYGDTWGEEGYIKMTRGIPNFCGLWDYVIYPVFNP